MWSADAPTVSAGLFAQLRFDLELTILSVLLIVLIVAGGIIVVRVRRRLLESEMPLSVDEQIRNYQSLVERGELDPREFERIKARLEQQASEAPPNP